MEELVMELRDSTNGFIKQMSSSSSLRSKKEQHNSGEQELLTSVIVYQAYGVLCNKRQTTIKIRLTADDRQNQEKQQRRQCPCKSV
eukprot:11385367-Ditylum_brightwellii.AAC.1